MSRLPVDRLGSALHDHLRPELLAVYLDDHAAGAAAGVALVRRMERSYAHEPGYTELTNLRQDIEADAERLAELRDRLDAHGGHLKRAVALLAERISRLVPNGRPFERTALDRVLEIEALMAGVVAKQRLWAALMVDSHAQELVGVDLGRLSDRAGDQLRRLGALHERAATSLPAPTSR